MRCRGVGSQGEPLALSFWLVSVLSYIQSSFSTNRHRPWIDEAWWIKWMWRILYHVAASPSIVQYTWIYSSVVVCMHVCISKNWHAVHSSAVRLTLYISNTSDKKQSESKNNYPLAVIGFKATVPCLAKSVSGLMTLSSPVMFLVLKQRFVCNISAWCSPFR